MADIYNDGSYFNQNPTWHQEDSKWKALEIIKMIERNKLPFCSVGDIGCGAGQVLVELAKRLPACKKYYGFETSPDAFSICKRKESKNIQFLQKDITSDSRIFDLLLIIDVFEHIDNYVGFLRAIRSRGQYTMFHIPLDLSVQSILRMTPILDARNSVGHLHYFSKETAIETLTYCGYKIIDYFYTPSSQLSPNKKYRTVFLNSLRKKMYSISKDYTVRLFGGYSLLVLTK